MYLYHFGLRELPFTLTPNTEFFYGLPAHQEALATLLTALKTGEGFIKVVGEVGTGKTLICRKLLNDLPEHFVTAYIPNPYLSPEELRVAVATELGVRTTGKPDQQQLTQRIQDKLLQLHQQGHSVVLILDEAQALPKESLEALRLFTNLETERRKLLQVVLFGQPELDQRLAGDELRQLRQRITFSYNLRPLNASEVHQYIVYRLRVAGNKSADLITTNIAKQIHRGSRGIPRLINVLAHKALILAYGQGRHYLLAKDVKAAIRDTEEASTGSGLWRWLCMASVSVVALLWGVSSGDWL
ncbi:AAA family ATPase [Corallincola holothuriorum]|uniref:AAA family ATPase n=1 Tax=Corallincola holothuriorum TaxID=2282215 RepID=A0A368NJL4_9GAMM|nr:AAA family ATPase [Corallincola holothuriorum]RCU49824.1 AAA family ATPase [Corallincola holothuriorum]